MRSYPKMLSVIAAGSVSVLIGLSAAGESAVAQVAQTTGADRKIDLHATLPGVAPREASAASEGGPKLTRDQRKEEALQARKQGTLKPAGEGADGREDAVARDGVKSAPIPAMATALPPAPETSVPPASALPTPAGASAVASSPVRPRKVTSTKTKKRSGTPAASPSGPSQDLRR